MTGGDIFALLSGEGAVIYNKLHGNRWLGNLLERNGFRMFRRAQRISDGNIGDSRDGDDRADGCVLYFYFVQTVEFIETADFYFLLFVRVMMVDKDHILVDGDCAVVNFSDTDASDILVVVNGADEHLVGASGSPSGAGI